MVKNYLAVFPGSSVRFLMTLIISGWPHVFTEASQAAAHRNFWQRMADCLAEGCGAQGSLSPDQIGLDCSIRLCSLAQHGIGIDLAGMWV